MPEANADDPRSGPLGLQSDRSDVRAKRNRGFEFCFSVVGILSCSFDLLLFIFSGSDRLDRSPVGLKGF